MLNEFLLAGNKFMPEMHLKQSGFTYIACGPFTKNKKKHEKFVQAGNTDRIHKNDLDKACFHHNVDYGKYKDLTKRTASDRVLRDKAFEIESNPKYDGYERGLASMVYKFFDKKSKGRGIEFMPNQLLADLADIQLINKYNKGIRYLLCVIDLFSKYGWVFPIKDRKGVSIINAFEIILDSSKIKPNKIWVYQGS